MKSIVIACLACLSITVQADTVATLRNKGGGLIVLTDVQTEVCKDFAGSVYSTNENSKTLWGCWFSDDLMVHVKWNDGDIRSYPISAFEVNVPNARRMRERNSRGGGTGV